VALYLAIVLLLGASAAAQIPRSLQLLHDPRGDCERGTVLVRFSPGAGDRERDHLSRALEAVRSYTLLDSDYVLYHLPSRRDVCALVPALERLPCVAAAQPNYIYRGLWVPDDSLFGLQWGLVVLEWEPAMDIYRGRADLRVAVIDSGVNNLHADLMAQVVTGYNTITHTTNTWDDNGHGTHVAGIIGAETDNGAGIAGTCPYLRLVPVKALNQDLVGTSAQVKDAIDWARLNGCHVINMSLGGTADDPAVRAAVENASAAGCVLVGAAGNSAGTFPVYPGAYEEVIDVGGTDSSDDRYIHSNYNCGDDQYVDLAAPAVGIISTAVAGGYDIDTGTSYAAPFASGLSALLYGALSEDEPTIVRSAEKAEGVREYIEGNTDWVGDWVRFGRVNAFKATRRALRVTVQGTIVLPGRLNPQNVQVVAYLVDGTDVLEARTFYPGLAGEFTLVFAHEGTLDIRFVTPGVPYLARRVRGLEMTIGELIPGVQVSLPGGDVLADGCVDLRDLALLLVYFGQCIPALDVDGSAVVDLADINIALLGFGEVADN
jgi:thermitase